MMDTAPAWMTLNHFSSADSDCMSFPIVALDKLSKVSFNE